MIEARKMRHVRKYTSICDAEILQEITRMLQGVTSKREITKAERLALMISNKARYGASLSVAIADSKARLVANTVKLTDDWVTGFTTGEASFMINYSVSDKRFGGCTLAIAQTSTNQQQLWAIKDHLGVGSIRPGREGTDTVLFEVNNLKEIMNVIIPFYDANPIQGNKALDYQSFREAAHIIDSGQGLTQGGYARLGELYLNINTSRDYSDPINQVMLVRAP